MATVPINVSKEAAVHRSRSSALIPVLAVALVLSACSGDGGAGEDQDAATGTAPDAPSDPGTFTIGVANDPGNLDPSMTVLAVTRTVSRLSYDTLVHQNDDGSFVSGLAQEWEVEPESVTFTLHDDITCSDGSALSATDVKDNIDFVSDPENQSPLLGVFLPAGLTTEADDEAGTVTVTATEPNAFLLHGFASVFIICRSGLDDPESLAQATQGTGAWVLEEAVADDHYTYSRREGYAWGPDGTSVEGPGAPSAVNVRVIANTTTLTNLLLAGEVNAATVIGADGQRLDNEGVPRVDVRASLGEHFFNQGPGRPGSDPQVREALLSALNIEALGTVANSGTHVPSIGLVTSQPAACPSQEVTGSLPTYDVAAANAALDAAGWVRSDGGVRSKDGTPLELTFIYPQAGGDSLSAAAELVDQMWTEVGADVTLQGVTSTQLNEIAFGTGAWDAGWVPITVSLPSQLTPFLSGPAVPDGVNFAHLDNAVYNESSVEAQGTGELEAACALWAEAETALITEGDVVPMFDALTGLYYNGGSVRYRGGELDSSSLRLDQ